MTTEKVNDLEIITLSDYFSADKFRLIPIDLAQFPGGISEVPILINIHPNFARKLSFDTNNLQHLSGFAIMGPKLQEINGAPYYSPDHNGKLKLIEMNDCGDLWIIKFEFFDETKKLYSVKMSEVPPLLNECRKPISIKQSEI